nr:intraflagellar transport protein 20 [Hymenolepis microstoma]
MAEHLAKNSLYVDDSNTLRILDPIITESTAEFRDQCTDLLNTLGTFQSVMKTAYETFESVSESIETAKMRCAFSQNQLDTVKKRKREELELLKSQVCEAETECERLKMELQSLERKEAEQKETIQLALGNR